LSLILVATVLARKSAVHPPTRFAAINLNTTAKSEQIPTNLIATS